MWSGDVDLADGELQSSYNAYQHKLQFAAQIGLPPRNSTTDEMEDLQKVLSLLEESSEVISTGMHFIFMYTVCRRIFVNRTPLGFLCVTLPFHSSSQILSRICGVASLW